MSIDPTNAGIHTVLLSQLIQSGFTMLTIVRIAAIQRTLATLMVQSEEARLTSEGYRKSYRVHRFPRHDGLCRFSSSLVVPKKPDEPVELGIWGADGARWRSGAVIDEVAASNPDKVST